MERRCLECDEPLIGRSDKKFCCDSCRNAHNNALNRDSKNLMRNINNRLRKNYRILELLHANDSQKVTRSQLIEMGFHFGYITSCCSTHNGHVRSFVYDHGYQVINEEWYALVKKES